MTCRLALERSKAPIAILLNNASSALERGGASNTPTICWPCGSIVETAAGTPIGQRAAKTCRTPQMKTAQLRHENRQRECITLDRTLAQLRCYLRWGDVSVISSEGVTPPSSLLRAHVPLPLGSLLLRHLASFEESWQVVRSPCCPRELPDVISENLSLDAGSHTPVVHRVLSPVSSTISSAFPT